MAEFITSADDDDNATPGERRTATALKAGLSEDALVWFNVPIGSRQKFPDFMIIDPDVGLLVLEVKDWSLSAIVDVAPCEWTIQSRDGVTLKKSPLIQARENATCAADILQKDKYLCEHSGKFKNKLKLPWAYGVVLANISRKQFRESGLGAVIDEKLVLCSDDLTVHAAKQHLSDHLRGMFQYSFRFELTMNDINRIRGQLYTSVRINHQLSILSDPVAVMDIRQEQIARSLRKGHRVFHGVAGSGKTLILKYRAKHLAIEATPERPILFVCYNKGLATWMDTQIGDKGPKRVEVTTFHAWCRKLLKDLGCLPIGNRDFDTWPRLVHEAIEDGLIKTGQYCAVLIDEGQDFKLEWIQILVKMAASPFDHVVFAYDNAQDVHGRQGRGVDFPLASAGLKARGRTKILRKNYRNPQPIARCAQTLRQLTRESPAAVEATMFLAGTLEGTVRVSEHHNVSEDIDFMVHTICTAHHAGNKWAEIAVLVPSACQKIFFDALEKQGIPSALQLSEHLDSPDVVHVMTYRTCKGLEFPVVVMPGVGTTDGELPTDQLYVAATRATAELHVGARPHVIHMLNAKTMNTTWAC